MALAGISRAANADELGSVQAWSAAGDTADEMRAGIKIKMKQRNGKPPVSLCYFDKPLRQAREARRRPATAAAPSRVPPAAPPPLSEAEKAAADAEERATAAQIAKAEEGLDAGLAARWASIRDRLKAEAGEAKYRTWMRQMTLAGVDGEEIVLTLPTGFLRDWVRSRYGDRLSALWRAGNPEIQRARLVVAAPELRSRLQAGPDPPEAAG
jgi:hypothetical protein